MMDKAFELEIVTPRKVVYAGDVLSFSAPGVLGGFQVLYNHAPLLAAIGIGEVKVTEAGGQEARYATSGGFVDVVNNHVTLLAESLEQPAAIDTARASAAKERAMKRLAERKPDTNIDRASVALARAINRLRVAQRG